jgi:NitT/TauT family transport system permease protein
MSVSQSDGVGSSLDEIERRLQRTLARRESRARLTSLAYPILTIVLLIALWELLTRVFKVPLFLLPPPSAVATSVYANFGTLAANGWITIVEIVLGFALSILVGVPLALAIFLWPPFSRAVLPLLVSSQAMPKVAVAPLFLVWFGFGLLPKVLIAFLIAFFPIVISTAVGLSSIEPEKINLARCIGLNTMSTFFKVRLPNALPSIFAGLKISITLAVVGAVVGEFVGGDAGLGYLLMVANGSMDTPLLFAGIVALTLLGVLFYMLIEVGERLVLPTHTAAQRNAAQAVP